MWSFDIMCNSECSNLGTVKCSSQKNQEHIVHCSPQVNIRPVSPSSPTQRNEQLKRQYLYLLSIEFLSSSEHIAFWTTFTSKLVDMNLEEIKNPTNQLLHFYFSGKTTVTVNTTINIFDFYERWKDNIKARTAKSTLDFSWF